MPQPLTLDLLRRELATTQDAIEKKIDQIDHRIDNVDRTITTRFGNFEAHFDDTMTAIRDAQGEVFGDLRAERRRELVELRQRLDRLAVLTGHPELATA